MIPGSHITTEAALRMLAQAIADAASDAYVDNLRKLRALLHEAKTRGDK